ncbi:hypothetical protein VAZ01S_016_00120 [Vibrio azureus NBRC 104587]|uniref:Lipo-like protein n=1 Tax=Vibrio azureus NBRC 104587 TaxID=1219077 RepID=U3C8U6_9VIBR|nr:hypothetical protein VAZ01S_016_00120 [Vibrio azureus NBRC 104587]
MKKTVNINKKSNIKKVALLAASLFYGATLVGCKVLPTQNEVSAEVTMKMITGTIAYRERIALPDNALVTVTLEDVSLADAPAEVLASQSFTTDGQQVPIAFELSYDSNDIQPNHRYSLRARIDVDGQLRFTTDRNFAVITDQHSTHNVAMRLVGVR